MPGAPLGAGIAMLPLLQPTLSHPAWQKGLSKGSHFRASAAASFLNLFCPYCLATKGWWGHPCQAEQFPLCGGAGEEQQQWGASP